MKYLISFRDSDSVWHTFQTDDLQYALLHIILSVWCMIGLSFMRKTRILAISL